MLKQGTMNDRVSALTTIVKRNPLHSISYLQNLIGLAKKNNKKLAELAIDSLKELFCDSEQALLKNDKKLIGFSKNEMLSYKSNYGPKELVDAYYESSLKDIYGEFISNVLKPLTHADLEFHRRYSLNILEYCLECKPELEDTIL